MDSIVTAAADRLRRKENERNRAAAARRESAVAFARILARNLGTADPTVRKIVGFGSTFETWRPYRLNSDIDLGVIGGDWWVLTKHVPMSEFEVSVVELELQNPEFRSYVEAHGEVLYEKS